MNDEIKGVVWIRKVRALYTNQLGHSISKATLRRATALGKFWKGNSQFVSKERTQFRHGSNSNLVVRRKDSVYSSFDECSLCVKTLSHCDDSNGHVSASLLPNSVADWIIQLSSLSSQVRAQLAEGKLASTNSAGN